MDFFIQILKLQQNLKKKNKGGNSPKLEDIFIEFYSIVWGKLIWQENDS